MLKISLMAVYPSIRSCKPLNHIKNRNMKKDNTTKLSKWPSIGPWANSINNKHHLIKSLKCSYYVYNGCMDDTIRKHSSL